MFQKTQLRILAMFMVCLVLSLPFYSAGAFAAGQIKNVYGEILEEGAESNARYAIKADVIVDGDASMQNEQVTFGGVNAETCSGPSASGVFTCQKNYPQTSGAVPYTVNLKDDSGNLLDTKTEKNFPIVFDTNPPSVKIDSSGESASKSDGKIEYVVDYAIEEHACSSNSERIERANGCGDGGCRCFNICSGIDRIEYGVFGSVEDAENADTSKNPIEIKTGINACSFSSKQSPDKKITIKNDELIDGRQTLIIKAIDNRGNIGEGFVPITFDKKIPDIKQDTFRLSKEGIEFLSYHSTPQGVTASIEIIDDNFDISAVKSDLSKLTKSDSDKERAASCSLKPKNANTYVCSWKINLNPESPTPLIKVTAIDKKKNTAVKEFQPTLVQDLGIDVDKISPEYVQEGNSRDVSAIFNEISGIKKENANINFNGNTISANSCSKIEREANKWECGWKINFDSIGTYQLTVDSSTSDIFGNKISASDKNKISVAVVDDKGVDIKEISVNGKTGDNKNGVNIENILQGGKMTATAKVESAIPFTATADFSRISSNGVLAGDCKKNRDDNSVGWECSWPGQSEVIASEHGKIIFVFTDSAGIRIEKQVQVNILGLAGEKDLWKVSESKSSCAPSVLDRKILEVYDGYPSRCTAPLEFLKVESEKKDYEVIDVSLDGGTCSYTDPTATINAESIKNPINKVSINEKGESPAVDFIFNKGQYLKDKLEIKCALSITTKDKTNLKASTEKDEVTFTLGLSSIPLDTYEANYRKKIEDIKAEIIKLEESKHGARDFLKWAERGCKAYGTFMNVRKTLNKLSIGLKGTALFARSTGVGVDAAEGLDAAGTAGCEAETETADTMDGLQGFIGKMCSYFTNCELPIDLPTYLDISKIHRKLGVSYIASEEEINYYMDVKNSLPLSAANLCVTGVVSSLERLRQIKCTQVSCLETYKSEGRDPSWCDDWAAYEKCKFVRGGWLSLIPFKSIIDHFWSLIKEVLSNPFSLGFGIATFLESKLCKTTCDNRDGGLLYGACSFKKIINQVIEVFKIVDKVWRTTDDFRDSFKDSQDVCKAMGLNKDQQGE